MRYDVRKVLRNYWQILDRWTLITEHVLFAQIGMDHARMWTTDEVPHAEALAAIADAAIQAGVDHGVRVPEISRIVYAGG